MDYILNLTFKLFLADYIFWKTLNENCIFEILTSILYLVIMGWTIFQRIQILALLFLTSGYIDTNIENEQTAAVAQSTNSDTHTVVFFRVIFCF